MMLYRRVASVELTVRMRLRTWVRWTRKSNSSERASLEVKDRSAICNNGAGWTDTWQLPE